jgi:hypothetical protein
MYTAFVVVTVALTHTRTIWFGANASARETADESAMSSIYQNADSLGAITLQKHNLLSMPPDGGCAR